MEEYSYSAYNSKANVRLSTKLKSQQPVKLEVTWHMGQKDSLAGWLWILWEEIPDMEVFCLFLLRYAVATFKCKTASWVSAYYMKAQNGKKECYIECILATVTLFNTLVLEQEFANLHCGAKAPRTWCGETRHIR